MEQIPKTVNPARILIVDDESVIRRLLKDILAQEGYRCETSGSGEDALEKIACHLFDLVMIDIRMPGMDGMELLGKVRDLKPGDQPIATIILTAVNALDMAIQAMKLGAYDYLTKPFSNETVLLSVAKALDRRRLVLENLDYQKNLETKVKVQSEKIQSSLLKTIESLSRVLQTKDSISREHGQRVTEIAVRIARELGLPPKEIENIRIASLLHDIGKLGVSEKILEKIHPLLDEEIEHIQRHPLVAENILGPIDDLEEIIGLIKHHHERWDGAGYPDKLKGEAIPLGSRILAVADSYDAMLSSRPYREPRKPREAIREIKSQEGKQFDPSVAEAFLKIVSAV